jgi:hypothetical protein
MTSFVKHIAVLAAALIATTALAEKSDDGKSSKPDTKEGADKKAKKDKGGKSSDDPNAPKKLDVPVAPGHDSKGLRIPYYNSTGKHEMEFRIGVASRLDANHVEMTNLSIETFNEAGEHEMQIDLPTAILDTDTSVVTSRKHVTIHRDDFDLTGETMIFNTRTKQGGLGGNVRMLIYNMDEQASGADSPGDDKSAVTKPKAQNDPDSFRTPQSKESNGTTRSTDNPDRFLTPGSK